MSDIAIRLLSAAMNRTPAAARQSQAQAKKSTAPKTDVIDLSRAPAPEQADRMRSAGFQSCDSASAAKTVATTTLGSCAATRVTMEYQHEHLDVTNGIAYHASCATVSTDTYTSGGFVFAGATKTVRFTWKDGSYWEATSHECAFSLEMGGRSSWYIPPRLNEDGSWSLAEYGPSARFTVSGYHSVFSFTWSDGEQTQTFWSETVAGQVKGTIPGGPLPDGAMSPPFPDDRDLLDRLDQLADRLRHDFDARA